MSITVLIVRESYVKRERRSTGQQPFALWPLLHGEQIEPAPDFGTAVDTAFILGMGKVNKKVIMLLDIDKVLSMATVSKVSK